MFKVGCCGFPVKRTVYYETFSVVEIQQTFYQLPRPETGRKWREEAPEGFEFTMKAWQLITHEPSSPTYRRLRETVPEKKKKNYGFFKETEEVEEAWQRTAEFARATGTHKIVFQTPASFSPSESAIRNVKKFFERRQSEPFTFIWEPRGEWRETKVKEICAELGVIACLDPFGSSLPKGDLLYSRLHGAKGYRYTYSEGEIRELVEKGRSYRWAYFMFNNVTMYEDARRMKELLRMEGGDG